MVFFDVALIALSRADLFYLGRFTFGLTIGLLIVWLMLTLIARADDFKLLFKHTPFVGAM